jgi:hypothetical protein
MTDMPNVTRQEISIGAWHHVSLEATFAIKKREPNPLRQRLERFEQSEAIERLERHLLRPNDAFYAILVREIKKLCRSDSRRSSTLTPSPIGDISFARD